MPNDNEDNDLVACISCSTQYESDELYHTSNSDRVCSDCMRTCEHCEWVGTEDSEWHSVTDELWCESCWENDSVYCNRCDYTYNGDRVGTNNIRGIEEEWCEYCTSDHATYCEDCDDYYSDDDGSCPTCNNSSRMVHQYSYKPNPVFHGVDPNGLYMGFELEMSLGRVSNETYNEATSKVLSLQQNNVCYLKTDASIEDIGFELVTHPHTLYSYEQATPLWNYIEDMRANYNARSWDTDSCGLHVHVSRSAFKSGAHTHRFLTLIYKNPKEMMKLAGRKNSRYAQFSDVYKPDEWGIPRFDLTNKIRNRHHTERYSAVNTQNDYTLELRFFRGTMARAGIMSALELAHAATEYTRNLSLADVKLGMLQWDWFADWVATNNGIYPNLYIKMSKIQKISLENREKLNA
jgi:hypothetical protein